MACQPFHPGSPGDLSASVQSRNVRGLLREAGSRLRGAGVDSPELDAELLLAEVLGVERLELHLEPGREPGLEAWARFEAMVSRRLQREPVAYILGRREFWGLDFEVGPGVLVPRPETEHIVEAVLERLGRRPLGTIVDLCCGAAPLAVALGLELHPRRIVGVDVSELALSYARRNVLRHGLDACVSLVAGDLMEPLRRSAMGPVELIVCNPPYIPSEDVEDTMPEVSRHEPRLALDGGPTGLELSARVFETAAEWIAPGGALVLETGAGLMPRLVGLGQERGFVGLEIVRDLAGRERALWLQKEGR